MKKYTHALAYAALSASYVGAWFGFDKSLVSMTTAGLYMFLAGCEFRKGE